MYAPGAGALTAKPSERLRHQPWLKQNVPELQGKTPSEALRSCVSHLGRARHRTARGEEKETWNSQRVKSGQGESSQPEPRGAPLGAALSPCREELGAEEDKQEGSGASDLTGQRM